MTEGSDFSWFRDEAHSLMTAFNTYLERMDLPHARSTIAELMTLPNHARRAEDFQLAAYTLNYSNAMLAETLAQTGQWQDASALVDLIWRALDSQPAQGESASFGMFKNKLLRVILLAAWAQVAWQHEGGTHSSMMEARQLSSAYLALRDEVERELTTNSQSTTQLRAKAKPILLAAGTCVIKASYRHSRKHLVQLVSILNQQDGAQLRIGKGTKVEGPSSPWYYDFEICKGLLDVNLDAFKYRQLAKAREELWPRKSSEGIPVALLRQWERERSKVATSSLVGESRPTSNPPGLPDNGRRPLPMTGK